MNQPKEEQPPPPPPQQQPPPQQPQPEHSEQQQQQQPEHSEQQQQQHQPEQQQQQQQQQPEQQQQQQQQQQQHHQHQYHHQSIFRSPSVQHYSLLHRSQRDPAINEPELGDRILHPIQRLNKNKHAHHNPRSTHPNDLQDSSYPPPHQTTRSNLGLASAYDIYYDDEDYDYMQHLRPIGLSDDAILIPSSNLKPDHQQRRSTDRSIRLAPIPTTNLIQLPDSLKPTPDHQSLSYSDHLQFVTPSHSAIPPGHLLPSDDDPNLRQVLDALEDEAYVDDRTDDDFFRQIIQTGHRDHHPSIDPPNPIRSSSPSSIHSYRLASDSSSHLIRSKPHPNSHPTIPASQFSMTSSAMFRNQGLTDLDDRFHQIEREYDSSSDRDQDLDDVKSQDSTSTQTPISNRLRDDFDSIMDEFLDRFEVIGGKLKRTLEGKTPTEKMDTLRNQLLVSSSDPQPSSIDPEDGTDESFEKRLMKDKILVQLRRDELEVGEDRARMMIYEPKDDRVTHQWDCQTILSTYSNLENHPRLIRIREAIGGVDGQDDSKVRRKKKLEGDGDHQLDRSTTHSTGKTIEIDRLTGFPIVDGNLIRGHSNLSIHPRHHQSDEHQDQSDRSNQDDLESLVSVRETIKRDRNEDKESKKARKSRVKAEQAVRRQVKKQIKESFTNERNKQERLHQKVVAQRSIDIGGLGGKGIMSLS